MQPLTRRTRTTLFLTACIGSRTLLALAAWTLAPRVRAVRLALAAACAAMAVGFLAVWALRLRPAPPEAGGVAAWWNPLRPVHAVLFAAAALALFHSASSTTVAAALLAADVVVGLVGFLWLRT